MALRPLKTRHRACVRAFDRVRDTFGDRNVGQVVLPALPGGSLATAQRRVNLPLSRNNDPPYVFPSPPIPSRTPFDL